jgi:hypothetical protein
VVAALGRLDDLVCSERPFINLGRFIVLDLVENSGGAGQTQH